MSEIISNTFNALKTNLNLRHLYDGETHSFLAKQFMVKLMKHSSVPKNVLVEKAKLLQRGIEKETVYFLGKDQPRPNIPDWYMDLTLKKKLSKKDEKQLLSAVEERRALFFLLKEFNELTDLGLID